MIGRRIEASAFIEHPQLEVAGVDRRNPFATGPYATARLRLGERPIVMSGAAGTAFGFERVAWLQRVLEIPSVPVGWQPGDWLDLLDLARRRGATKLELNSYGAIGATLPDELPLVRRWRRAEHLIDLTPPDLVARCHRTHRQRIRQAEREGCTLEWSGDRDALLAHARLIAASMERRQGGPVAIPDRPTPIHEAMVATGAGELALVRRSGEVVASTLVLLAPEGGYLHSSGSAAAGKSVGAHHFMVMGVALRLKSTGCTTLNLGGTRDEERGLREFKNHFGATEHGADAGIAELPALAAKLSAAGATILDRLRASRAD